jgi:hypothetical protein
MRGEGRSPLKPTILRSKCEAPGLKQETSRFKPGISNLELEVPSSNLDSSGFK